MQNMTSSLTRTGLQAGFLFLSLLMAACSAPTKPVQQAAPKSVEQPKIQEQKQEVTQSEPIPQKPAEPEPVDSNLSPELLFRLMVAEISGQRGNINLAVQQYLEAAKISMDPKVIERATRIAVYSRNTKSAMEAATLWAQVAPDSIEAQQVAAAMHVRNGNIAQAHIHLEKMIDLSEQAKKTDRNTFMLITSLLGKEKDKKAALDVMQQVVRTRQDNPEALYAYSQLALLVGDLEKAMNTALQVIALRSDWADAYILYSNTLYRMGKKAQALQQLHEALKKVPQNITLRDYYARRLVDEKRYVDAQREFRKVIEQEPKNYDALYALALLSLQTGELEESNTIFQRLVKAGERTFESSFYLGQIAEQQGDNKKAIEWYKVISNGQYKVDAQVRIALIEAKQGYIKAGRERLRAIQIDSAEVEQRLILAEGEILREAKLHQEAFDLYSEGLARMPDNPTLLYARALTAEKIERIDVTFSDLEKVIKLDPNNAQALNALGYTLVDRTERYKEGLDYIQRAYNIQPDDAAILDSLGWANYRLGNHEAALKFLRKAFDKLKDAEIAAHLGEVLWVMGEHDSARDIWDAALRVDPAHQLLLDVINRFVK